MEMSVYFNILIAGLIGAAPALIFWIAVIIGIFFLIKWIVQQSSPKSQCVALDSLEILKKRYAEGEIEKEEFEQKKKDLLK